MSPVEAIATQFIVWLLSYMLTIRYYFTRRPEMTTRDRELLAIKYADL